MWGGAKVELLVISVVKVAPAIGVTMHNTVIHQEELWLPRAFEVAAPVISHL